MRLSASLFAACLLTAFTIRPSHAQPAPQPAKPPTAPSPAKDATTPRPAAIVWESSFAAALGKAKTTHKPVMVVFYATWCPACQFLQEKTCKNADVIALASQFISVQVNIDKETALAKHYGASATPTIGWLDAEGRVLNGIEGVGPVAEFLAEMQAALARFKAPITPAKA